MAYDIENLREIERRLVELSGPNFAVESLLHGVFPVTAKYVPNYTASLDAAVSLVERALPGWLWRVASCFISDDAFVMPDFNHPVHGPALLKWATEAEQRDWFEVHPETDIDQRPPGRPALALCNALVAALIVKETAR